MACVFSIVYNSCGCAVGYNLPLQTTAAVDIFSYPVTVLNVNEVEINTAGSPDEYADIWNSDAANKLIGTLYAGSGAFCFYLVKTAVAPPPHVLGIQIILGDFNDDFNNDFNT
jgi:hypothetical protein